MANKKTTAKKTTAKAPVKRPAEKTEAFDHGDHAMAIAMSFQTPKEESDKSDA